MALKTTFICPYCYDVSKLSDVKYYCKKCDEAKVIEKKGPAALNPFATPLSVLCPSCGTSSSAVCPKCERKLPEGSLSGSNTIISVVGTRGSGKSHFVGVLINELYKRIAADFGASFIGFDQSHSLWEKEFGSLYSTLQALDLTVVGERKDPLIYELIFNSHGMNRMYTFAFFDTAGENLNSEDNMSVLNKYIYQSSGIIFLFDPLQIPTVKGRIREEVAEGSSAGGSYAPNTEVLTHVSNLIRNYHGMKRTEKIDIPVAIVFTKLDAIKDLLPEGSTIIDNSPHRGVVVENDLLNVSLEVQALLTEWGEASFIRQVELEYSNTAYFAISALGFDNFPDAHNDRKINKPQPHRIEDPFLWVLKENGILGGKGLQVVKRPGRLSLPLLPKIIIAAVLIVIIAAFVIFNISQCSSNVPTAPAVAGATAPAKQQEVVPEKEKETIEISFDSNYGTTDSTATPASAGAAGTGTGGTAAAGTETTDNGSAGTGTTATGASGTKSADVTKEKFTKGEPFGTLPNPSRSNFQFLGWFTKPIDGDAITSTSTANLANGTTLYAHWKAIESSQILTQLEPTTTGGDRNGFEKTTEAVKDNMGTSYTNALLGSDYRWNEYSLGGKYAKFTATLAITFDDRTSDSMQTVLVYGDGQLLYMSPTIKKGVEPFAIDVNITGVKTLRIETRNLYNSYQNCTVIVASPKVETSFANPKEPATPEARTYLENLDYFDASRSGGGLQQIDARSIAFDNLGNGHVFGLSIIGLTTRDARSTWNDYKLGGKFSTLNGQLAVSWGRRDEANAVANLSIYGDGELIYTSPDITKGVEPITFSVDVEGVSNLRVEASKPASNYYFYDDSLYLFDCYLLPAS